MSTGLIDIMKRASMDAMDNSKPCDLRYGTVVSTSPLKINISQELTLPASVLIVPEHLTNHKREVTIDWSTEDTTHTHTSDTGSISNETHNHKLTGKKTMTIHGALKSGDKVALLRQAGGQSYFILDRI